MQIYCRKCSLTYILYLNMRYNRFDIRYSYNVIGNIQYCGS